MPNPSQQGFQPSQQKQPSQYDPYANKAKVDDKSCASKDKEGENCSTKNEQGFRKDTPDAARRASPNEADKSRNPKDAEDAAE